VRTLARFFDERKNNQERILTAPASVVAVPIPERRSAVHLAEELDVGGTFL